MSDNTVVLLSGGQDSALCLMWAKQRYSSITALSIDYGQRHQAELDAAKKIAALAEVKHVVVKCPITSDNALTNHSKDIEHTGELPSTFVPGRNLLFIALAATFNPDNIVIGACETDYSGYPDCRNDFIVSVQSSVRLALGTGVTVHTPLMYLSKAHSVKMATKVPLAWQAIALSVTCYNGTRCMNCPSCDLRAKGFEAAGKVDPAE